MCLCACGGQEAHLLTKMMDRKKMSTSSPTMTSPPTTPMMVARVLSSRDDDSVLSVEGSVVAML